MIDRDWHRFHPLSPLIRGGVASVAVVGWVVSQQFDRIFGADPNDPTQGHLGVGALLALLVVAGIIAAGWATWLVSRYRLGGTTLEMHTGLLFRQHRQIRYDRIQAVDIVRPFLARLLGLSELRVESAGGGDSNVRLAFLEDRVAQELRDELMTLAAISDEAPPTADGTATDHRPGSRPGSPLGGPGAATSRPEWPGTQESGAAGPGDPTARQMPGGTGGHGRVGYSSGAGAGWPQTARSVLRIPNVRLVQSFLYSPAGIFLVVAVPTVLLAFQYRWVGLLPTLGPATLAVGARHIGQMVAWFNFDLSQTRDVLGLRHGLSELRTSSLPLHRIQAVELSQNIAWRPVGWWRVEVNVAGVGGRQDTETTVLPVGTSEEALRVLGLLIPGSDLSAVREAMEGIGPGERFVTLPRRARWLDPLVWRRCGYAVTDRSVVVRAGALYRRAQIVPHARIQSLTLRQGPVARWLDLADVHLVSTPGRVTPVVAHLARDEAERLLNEQMVRSSRARRSRDRADDIGPAPTASARSPEDTSDEAVAQRRET